MKALAFAMTIAAIALAVALPAKANSIGHPSRLGSGMTCRVPLDGPGLSQVCKTAAAWAREDAKVKRKMK